MDFANDEDFRFFVLDERAVIDVVCVYPRVKDAWHGFLPHDIAICVPNHRVICWQ